MTRTYLDTGILLAAARKQRTAMTDRCIELLDDASRDFVSSQYLELELLPKAVYHSSKMEEGFYRAYFANAQIRISMSAELGREALLLATQYGLSGFDALHVASAIEAKCVEFVTLERSQSPLIRVREIQVISIR